MRLAHPCRLLGGLMLILGAVQSAHAAPITYQFTTDPLTVSPPPAAPPVFGPASTDILNALNGLSVTGTFAYDSATPLSSTTSGLVINQANYLGAVSGMSGSIGALSFTTSTGFANVADEGYPFAPPPNPPVYEDFLQVAGTASSGITAGGASLFDIRLFWIEGDSVSPGTPDFLTNNDLPGQLPGFSGRLALDFLSSAPTGGQAITTAFFNDLTVTPTAVAEPGTVALAVLAGAALLGTGWRRKRVLLRK